MAKNFNWLFALKSFLLSPYFIGYSLYHILLQLKGSWDSVLLYSAITEHIPCNLGLIALLPLGQTYGKLNQYVITSIAGSGISEVSRNACRKFRAITDQALYLISYRYQFQFQGI